MQNSFEEQHNIVTTLQINMNIASTTSIHNILTQDSCAILLMPRAKQGNQWINIKLSISNLLKIMLHLLIHCGRLYIQGVFKKFCK